MAWQRRKDVWLKQWSVTVWSWRLFLFLSCSSHGMLGKSLQSDFARGPLGMFLILGALIKILSVSFHHWK